MIPYCYPGRSEKDLRRNAGAPFCCVTRAAFLFPFLPYVPLREPQAAHVLPGARSRRLGTTRVPAHLAPSRRPAASTNTKVVSTAAKRKHTTGCVVQAKLVKAQTSPARNPSKGARGGMRPTIPSMSTAQKARNQETRSAFRILVNCFPRYVLSSLYHALSCAYNPLVCSPYEPNEYQKTMGRKVGSHGFHSATDRCFTWQSRARGRQTQQRVVVTVLFLRMVSASGSGWAE